MLPPGFLAAQAQGQPAPPPSTGPGWWRRNWWGLLVIVPLLVTALGPELPELYRKWHNTKPNERVHVAGGQWASFGGGRIRLISLKRAPALTTYEGRPYTPPVTMQIWQATVEVDVTEDADLEGCDFSVADARGRVFSASPQELNGVDVDRASCLRLFDAPKTGPFTVVATFATSALPQGLRVTVGTELPRYLWLTAPD
ncbi:hypothetical protein ACFQX7_39555 [Luedemannella flava]